MKCCFRICLVALSLIALSPGCRVRREVQAHIVETKDSLAERQMEEVIYSWEKEWQTGVLEQIEVEFFPPVSDSVDAVEQQIPAVKRIVHTTIRTQNDREAEVAGVTAVAESIQLRAVRESSFVRKQRSRPLAWPWILLLAVVVGGAVWIWRRVRKR